MSKQSEDNATQPHLRWGLLVTSSRGCQGESLVPPHTRENVSQTLPENKHSTDVEWT